MLDNNLQRKMKSYLMKELKLMRMREPNMN